jgi:predicted MFS family arabinose efflux permease
LIATVADCTLGSVVIPAIFRPLIVSVGFGWAVRIIAFIILGCILLSLFTLKQRPSPNKPRKLIDPTAFREMGFNIFTVALFFAFAGLYLPFYYLPIFAEEKLGASQNLTFDVLSILGGGSIIGRILPGILAVHFGTFNLLGFCVLMSGKMLFIWGAVHNTGGLAALTLFYGIFSGMKVGFLPVALAELSPTVALIGTRTGMSLTFAAMGILVGNPIAGAILKGKPGFEGLQAFGGAFMIFSSLLLFLAALAYRKRRESAAT